MATEKYGIVVLETEEDYIVATRFEEYRLVKARCPDYCRLGEWIYIIFDENKVIIDILPPTPKTERLDGIAKGHSYSVYEPFTPVLIVKLGSFWTLTSRTFGTIVCQTGINGDLYSGLNGRVVVRRTTPAEKNLFEKIDGINPFWQIEGVEFEEKEKIGIITGVRNGRQPAFYVFTPNHQTERDGVFVPKDGTAANWHIGDWIKFMQLDHTFEFTKTRGRFEITCNYCQMEPLAPTTVSNNNLLFEIKDAVVPSNMRDSNIFDAPILGLSFDGKRLMSKFIGRNIKLFLVRSLSPDRTCSFRVFDVKEPTDKEPNIQFLDVRDELNQKKIHREKWSGSKLHLPLVHRAPNTVWSEKAFVFELDKENKGIQHVWLMETGRPAILRNQNQTLGSTFEGLFKLEDYGRIVCVKFSRRTEHFHKWQETGSGGVELNVAVQFNRRWRSYNIFRTQNLGDVVDLKNILCSSQGQVFVRRGTIEELEEPLWIVTGPIGQYATACERNEALSLFRIYIHEGRVEDFSYVNKRQDFDRLLIHYGLPLFTTN